MIKRWFSQLVQKIRKAHADAVFARKYGFYDDDRR